MIGPLHKDVNGFPMAVGTTISVKVEGTNIKTIGDLGGPVKDVYSDFSNIDQLTKYSFIISDSQADSAVASGIVVTIKRMDPMVMPLKK